MSAKTMSSLTDENRDLRKQIGCMNGIFQIFDRHHFLTGRRMSSHHHKRLLQGEMISKYPQRTEAECAQHQLDPQYATKAVTNSSTRNTFTQTKNNPESPFQIKATKEPQPPLTKSTQSLDLRDVVKDSMYREARTLSIKSLAKDERKGTVMKHIDSPRPSQLSKSKTPKATSYEGSTRVLADEGIRNSIKDDRLALPRFSYDGRESRETSKWAMKHKELPRLSLDSKASSLKCSALESRLNFLGRDSHMQNEVLPLNQEPGSHNRTSSVVAKLMGLDTLKDTISADDSRTPTIKSSPKEAFLSQLTSTTEKSNQNQVTHSPRVSQNNPASPSPRFHNANLVRKPNTCSKFPIEPAPWRQQDSGQGSPKMASQARKAPKSTTHLSSSVYGEIEKRITELQFQKSGKDLRALKQILEAMQKSRDRLDDRTGESAELTSQRRCTFEDSYSDQNSNLSMWKNSRSNHQIPTTKGPCTPKQLGSSVVIIKPAKVMDKVKLPVSTRVPTMEISNQQGLQTRKYHVEISAHMQKTKDLKPKNNNLKDPRRHLPPTDKKTAWGTSEVDRTITGPQRKKVENCSTPGRSFGMASPRLQQNLFRIERQSHSTTPSADSGRVKKHCSKKFVEKGSQNRKYKVKAKDLQLSDDQLSEISSETRYSSYQGDTASVISESNNSLVSQPETEVISLARSINTNAGQKENSVSTTRENMPAVEFVVTMSEQPSPISVLDDTFYCEESPSPVKIISTAFRDESPSPDEAEWHLENLNHLTDCTRSNHACKYNQKLESVKNSVHELTLLNTKPDETAVDHNALVYRSHNPDHRYINKILLTSGLLKDSSFISTADQLLSSCHLINPHMFHVLEQAEEIMEELNGEVSGKSHRMQLNKKIQRKIIFDMVDEILVRKITSGRLFTMGNKMSSPQGLLKEVYLEMDRVCRIPDCNLDDEEDKMIRLLTADMMHQSEDWVDNSGEVPALVLDIERLIFKDLINEVVTGEVMGLHDWPKRHCRKLFSK
ncbi:hypothetical protein DH2020_037125 [Rehmannia glutinosa]|uniref:DUF4378 domain-containing protein n=1 Tax=Rehmannia glutinosa TaxID=99300 RepID=A0ABR0V4W9_REHGL